MYGSEAIAELRLEDVPSYLRRYAIEVDAWARQAGGQPVLSPTAS